MTHLANYLSLFLQEYLPYERKSSQNTCETYAYTFQLLVCYCANQLRIKSSNLNIEHFDVPLLVKFLKHLENERGNSARTRNARLAAIKAFFRFLEYRLPSCLQQARCIHAIPVKKVDKKLIDYLTKAEMQALLDAPDPKIYSGVRDKAMIYLAYAAGLRVSELVGLNLEQIEFNPYPVIQVCGKSRKERIIPLWKETVLALRAWITIRNKTTIATELFLNAQSNPITRSGFKYILAKHLKAATMKQPTLEKKRISPHVLRHTCAMHTLQATHDIRKVSLWLGHVDLKSTEVYLQADPSEKFETLNAGMPLTLQRGKFKAPDKLLAMLKNRN